MPTYCLNCDKELIGRADKKFCDSSCRSAYYNKKNKEANVEILAVNKILKKNRKILSHLIENKEGTKKIKKEELLKKGFDFNYHTEIYKTKKDKEYTFVYDYGYLWLDEEWLLIVSKN